jgi:hypothetical protein
MAGQAKQRPPSRSALALSRPSLAFALIAAPQQPPAASGETVAPSGPSAVSQKDRKTSA